MQANNGTIIITIIACAVLLAGFVAYMQPATVDPVEVPTAAEIAALVSIPAPIDYSSQIEEILESLVWSSDDISEDDVIAAIALLNYSVSEIESELRELLAELLDIDENDLNISKFVEKDIQVTATSEDEADDGNFKVEGFYRVVYTEDGVDAHATVIYVVVTAYIEDLNGGSDREVAYSIREVTVNFEFD